MSIKYSKLSECIYDTIMDMLLCIIYRVLALGIIHLMSLCIRCRVSFIVYKQQVGVDTKVFLMNSYEGDAQ